MFQTITKSNGTSGKLLGVKLTQTMSAINEAWVDFNEANIDMLEKVDTLDKISSDVILLENLTKQVTKTKLQPSMCTYLGAMEGVSQIAGVDFTKVTDANRAQMTQTACEGFKETAKNVWKKIKEWFGKILQAIKDFFVRMFSLTARQANAIKKLEEGILKDKAKIDAKAFDGTEYNGYSSTKFKTIADALKSLHTTLVSSAGSLHNEKFVKIDPKELRVVGYKYEKDKIVSAGDKFKKEKKSFKGLGWTVDSVAAEMTTVKELLKNILNLKNTIAQTEAANKTAQKQCDVMATAEGKSDEEKAKVKDEINTTKKNMVVFTKLVSIYSSNAHALIGQIISMVSKMKVSSSEEGEKKEKKKK